MALDLPPASLALVATGGAVGAALRVAAGTAVMSTWPGIAAWPVATFGVNVLGSFLLGALAGWSARGGAGGWHLFLGTGLLGGFTTFSTFSLELVELLERGDMLHAVAHAGLSLAGGVGALWLGLTISRGWA